jgi:signal transduction histidine kinase
VLLVLQMEARAWSKADLHVISTFLDRVCEHFHMRMMQQLKNDIELANVKYFDALERVAENSDWFAHMSHEIRTPFHGVMGVLNILQENGYNMTREDMQDLVNTALSSGNHMINLLDDILDIAKVSISH